jgi:calcineurin-like phosphoesterase family protein
MDAVLIENWNAVVAKDDTVYLVGDFSFCSARSVKPVLKVLNGAKHLIMRNHDKTWMKNVRAEEFFASVSSLLEIDDGDTHITLCHYPMLSWNRVAHGAIHIHGHIHNNTQGASFGILENMSAYNAGVDVNGFKPVTLEQLITNKAMFYSQVRENGQM